MNHLAYLSAGSNLGNRSTNLQQAISAIGERTAAVRKVSAMYETEPVGFCDQPWFLNVAIQIETSLAPPELLDRCQEIEQAHGRIRVFQNAPRTLDLDILLYDDLAVSTARLTIPHPRMANRKFVLVPLAEIAPDVVHPLLKQTIRSLLDTCRDSSQVRKY